MYNYVFNKFFFLLDGGRSDTEYVNSVDNEASRSLDSEPTSGSTMRSSKSDTSLTDSFVVVDNDKPKVQNQENILREGVYSYTIRNNKIFL